jgi:prepilin-type processing-associated H-X9-DG protein
LATSASSNMLFLDGRRSRRDCARPSHSTARNIETACQHESCSY